MQVYNTLTRQKEKFVPLEAGKVKMYVCGPTVYNRIHIGNARPVVVFDVLRRFLTYKGYQVTFARNFTDIDDKIIQRAVEEGVSSKEIAETYIKEFNIDAQGLGVGEPDITPLATETIPEIVSIVENIVNAGYGYEVDGDVYFRARKFKGYGKLSRQSIEDLNLGSRVASSEEKEDLADFALWKRAKEGEPSWDSPWGKGRPGWHIECSAMVKKHLGEQIDIHGGGQDLIFPHHENEIAQSECCGETGKNYVNYWMHNGYITVDNEKMAKSEGNFFTVRDVADKYGYEPIKLMLLSAHYRSPLNYSPSVIEQSITSLARLYTSRENLDFAIENNLDDHNTSESDDFIEVLQGRKAQFDTAMEDDLNTADGLSAIFELVRDINSYTAQPRPRKDLEAAAQLFDTLTGIMGLLYNRKKETADEEIMAQIAKREQARKDKDFTLADSIREALKAQGIELEDTPQGVKYHIVP